MLSWGEGDLLIQSLYVRVAMRNLPVRVAILMNALLIGMCSFAEVIHDKENFVGLLRLQPVVTEEKAVEMASLLAKEFPNFVSLSVRLCSQTSYCIELNYKKESESVKIKDFVAKLESVFKKKYGSGVLSGWDLSSQIVRVKN